MDSALLVVIAVAAWAVIQFIPDNGKRKAERLGIRANRMDR